MTTSLVMACWTAAVTLALYGLYCRWEAGRADLAAGFRHHVLMPSLPGTPVASPSGATYRARARWALLGAGILSLGSLLAIL